jgi:asparagine synthase (glutamine-hydrolysing)
MRYWSAHAVANQGQNTAFDGSFTEAVDAVEHTLSKAVLDRMVADVDLGALLSGGIDSSSVTALMQASSTTPIKTFCIGFDAPEVDEAPHAEAVARHLGTDHTTLYASGKDALDLVPAMPCIYDEPFADDSQIPTYLVSKLARQKVTVVLSGDGGDEVFAGYSSYPGVLRRWRQMSATPLTVRRAMALFMTLAGQAAWSVAERSGRDHLSDGTRDRHRLAKLEKYALTWPATSPADLSIRQRARVAHASDLVVGARQLNLLSADELAGVEDPLLAIQYADFITYMSDDILVKVDRASMAVGLEVRCPLLDPRVVELAWSLPAEMRLGSVGGKRVLREMLYRHVPRSLVDRPKRGFGTPISAWLAGPLRDWAETLLGKARLQADGYLKVEAVQRLWRQHCTGWDNHKRVLWTILMFQAWLEERRRSATMWVAA